MAIQPNQTAVAVEIASTDTTILNPTTGRAAVTFASLHDQSGSGDTVEIFLSSDATSAAGERIWHQVFAANETYNPVALLLTIPSGYYLIGKATTGARIEVNLAYTQYTGAS